MTQFCLALTLISELLVFIMTADVSRIINYKNINK